MVERPHDLLLSMEALRSADAKRLFKAAIFERDGHRCRYCGSDEHLTLDHVKAKAAGGEFVASNLVTACLSCNRSKGSTPVLDWLMNQHVFQNCTL
jgi:5-methylcytosine-specific restriction endonuclease McrA